MNRSVRWIAAAVIVLWPLAAAAQPPAPPLPAGATVEKGCVPGLGSLAYRPRDLPFGPYYGVHRGRLIFTEYKVTLEEAQRGRLTNLKSLTGPIDHVDVQWYPRGHPGYEAPHFDVFLWNIPHEERQAIRCP